jgi:hypothetical protein
MKGKIRRQFISLFLCLPLLACALESFPISAYPSSKSLEEIDECEKRAHMLNDLDIIKHIFQTGYAPAQWKKTCFGWDLEEEIEKAKHQVLEAPGILTTKEFQRILKNFFAATKDYHVNVRFFSTEYATLPFSVQGANGRYFFTYIHRDLLSSDDPFPFSIGDELLLFDDIPIDQVVSEFRESEIGNNHSNTDQALAEMYLTTRSGQLGDIVPQGSLIITGIKKDSATPTSHPIEWEYYPEEITSAFQKQAKKGSVKSFFKTPNYIWPHYESWAKIHAADSERLSIGSRKSAIPPLGKIIWETDQKSFFHAYLFKLPNRKIGAYIRIPTYYCYDETVVQQFAKIIKRIQKHANVLVIDQLNNPGGDLIFAHDLAAMLTDRPLSFLKERAKITQEDVAEAVFWEPILQENLFDDESSDHPRTQSWLNYFQFIIEEWNQSRQFTSLHDIYGINQIIPHPATRYTKPLLILVDSLNFSCGDLFPAIMQDNHRATIMGTRTAGAGGYVKYANFPNLSGLSEFSYTGSLTERSNQQLIENQGVIPDIIYEVSENDLLHRFSEYREKIVETMESLIPADAPPTEAEEEERCKRLFNI